MPSFKIVPPTSGNNKIRFDKNSRPLVQCHGCFDMLHIGHIRHLQAAKKLGHTLIVTITSDKFVNKGKNRPIFTAVERAEALCALQCVDYVMINDAETAIPAIELLKPDFYVKGSDYKNHKCTEFNAVRIVGGKLVFTNTPKYSTTRLIEKLKKC